MLKVPPGFWAISAGFHLHQTQCKTNTSTLKYRFPNGLFGFHLKIRFEPVFGPNKRRRRSEPNQGCDKAVTKDRAESVMASNQSTSHLDPFKSWDNPDEKPAPHCGLPSITYLLPSPIPSSRHSTSSECSSLSLDHLRLSPLVSSA